MDFLVGAQWGMSMGSMAQCQWPSINGGFDTIFLSH